MCIGMRHQYVMLEGATENLGRMRCPGFIFNAVLRGGFGGESLGIHDNIILGNEREREKKKVYQTCTGFSLLLLLFRSSFLLSLFFFFFYIIIQFWFVYVPSLLFLFRFSFVYFFFSCYHLSVFFYPYIYFSSIIPSFSPFYFLLPFSPSLPLFLTLWPFPLLSTFSRCLSLLLSSPFLHYVSFSFVFLTLPLSLFLFYPPFLHYISFPSFSPFSHPFPSSPHFPFNHQ